MLHLLQGFGDKVAELANFTTSAVYLLEPKDAKEHLEEEGHRTPLDQ